MQASFAVTRPSLWKRFAVFVVPPMLAAGVVIALWYLSSWLQFDGTRERDLSQPYLHDVIGVGFIKTRNRNQMLAALWETTQVALIGLVVAAIIGIATAVLMRLSTTIERTLYPYAIVLQTLPIVAITPLMIVWFGTSKMPRVVVCVLIALFPIITNTLFGLKAADRAQHDLFTLHGARRLRRLWNLELPAALPATFTGLRIAAGLSVIGAIVGEFFFKSGPEGIGRRIQQYTQRNETPKVIAAVTLTGVLGLIIFGLVGWIDNRTTKHWRPEARARPT
jgi:NitT/TauT family transport system permease protein